MKQMLRHQGKFQCFVLTLSLVDQLSVSFAACDCLVILCYNKTKICRPCFQKTSYITRDTEAPRPLNNTYFKLQVHILTHYSPSLALLVTAIYTKCFFLFPICVKQNQVELLMVMGLSRVQ